MRINIFSRASTPDASTSRFRRAPHVLATPQGDELVLFDTARERYYTLNDVGARVWVLLALPMAVAELAAVIRREYEVPRDSACDSAPDPVSVDVTRLVRELHGLGMVTVERIPGLRS
jgi:hypothetical protein